MMLLWTVASVLCLFGPVQGDFTSHHLYNYLNHSVSACSDFHTHVCSSIMDVNDTIPQKTVQFYENLAAKMNSRSRKNPIMNDIYIARESNGYEFEASLYEELLRVRCEWRYNCYADEFKYFFKIYQDKNKVEDTMSYFAKRVNIVQPIGRVVNVISNMVKILVENADYDYEFEKMIALYENLRDRIAVWTAFKHQRKSFHILVNRLQNMTAHLKDAIAIRFKETQWLKDTDGFGLDRLTEFLEKLEELDVGFDFHEETSKLPYWKSVDRFVSSKYSEHSNRTTGCQKYDVLHSFITLNIDWENDVDSGEDWHELIRIQAGFEMNAYYGREANAATILAPYFTPLLMANSSETTLISVAATIAHEVFHSVILSKLKNESETFEQGYNCYVEHFKSRCDVWAPEGNCSSGEQTFEEDAPDVEGYRAAFDLIRATYPNGQLKTLEYAPLGITREQAFFYALAAQECTRAGEKFFDPKDEHSFNPVRLNAALSMMPEFTEAFGCLPGDELYAEATAVCYLFGPQAGMDRGEEETTEEIDQTDEDKTAEENVEDTEY